MSDTQIIHIEEAKKGLTIKKNENYCSHSATVLVDEQNRTLECEQCGQILDPFSYMMGIARGNDHAFDRRSKLQKGIRELSEKVEELKRQERNTKARLRRAKSKIKEMENE